AAGRSRPVGTAVIVSAGTAISSASAPIPDQGCGLNPSTRSPEVNPDASLPTPSTMPAKSQPSTCRKPVPPPAPTKAPCVVATSHGPSAAYTTRISAPSSVTTGSSTSRTSTPPSPPQLLSTPLRPTSEVSPRQPPPPPPPPPPRFRPTNPQPAATAQVPEDNRRR